MGWSDPLGYYKFDGWSGFPVPDGAPSWQLQSCIAQLHLAWYERLMALGGTNDLPNIFDYIPVEGGTTVNDPDDLNYLFGDNAYGVTGVPEYYRNSGDDASLQAWLQAAYPDVADYPAHLPPLPKFNSYSPPQVMITGGGGAGATAVATNNQDGTVTITLATGGSGYTSAPTVTVTGGSGSGVAATATITGDSVSSIATDDGGSGFGFYESEDAQTAWRGNYARGEFAWGPIYDRTFTADSGGDDPVPKWVTGAMKTIRGLQEDIHAKLGNFVIYPAVGGDDYDGYAGGTWDWTGDSVTFQRGIPNFNAYAAATNAGVPIAPAAGFNISGSQYYSKKYFTQFKHLFGNSGSYIGNDGDPETYGNSPSVAYTDDSEFMAGDLAVESGDNQQDEDAEGFVGYTAEPSGDWVVVDARAGTGRVFQYKGGDVRWGTISWDDGIMAHTLAGDLAAVAVGGNSTLTSDSYSFTSSDVSKPIWINGTVYYVMSVDSGVATIYGDCTADVTGSSGAAYMSGWAMQPPGTRPDIKTGYGFARRDDIITADLVNQVYAMINVLRWTAGGFAWYSKDGDQNIGLYSVTYDAAFSDTWSDIIDHPEIYGTPWTTEGTDSGDAPFTYSWGLRGIQSHWDGSEFFKYADGIAASQSVLSSAAQASVPVGIAAPIDTRFDPHLIACDVDFLLFAGIDDDDPDIGTTITDTLADPDDPEWHSVDYEFDTSLGFVFRTWHRFDSEYSSGFPLVTSSEVGSLPPAQPDLPPDQTPPDPPTDGRTYEMSKYYLKGCQPLLTFALRRWDVGGGFQFVA